MLQSNVGIFVNRNHIIRYIDTDPKAIITRVVIAKKNNNTRKNTVRTLRSLSVGTWFKPNRKTYRDRIEQSHNNSEILFSIEILRTTIAAYAISSVLELVYNTFIEAMYIF